MHRSRGRGVEKYRARDRSVFSREKHDVDSRGADGAYSQLSLLAESGAVPRSRAVSEINRGGVFCV